MSTTTYDQLIFKPRTYVSNDESIWNNCIKANVSAIATDKVSNYSWCKVSNTAPYAVKKP